MDIRGLQTRLKRGSSLIEVVIAVGTLAVAIPLVFAALAESGKSSLASEAETRSTWMIPACMDEIRASREGRPEYFTATNPGQNIPAGGDIWALAFSPEGKPVGKLNKADYDKGKREIDGQRILYVASISTKSLTVPTGSTPMLRAHISLEFPASAPVLKRQKLDFFTRIP